MKIFSKVYQEVLVDEPRETGNSVDNITELEGVTLGERIEQEGFGHKPKEDIWANFTKWYAKS